MTENEQKINWLEQEVKALKKERDNAIEVVRSGLSKLLDIPGVLPQEQNKE